MKSDISSEGNCWRTDGGVPIDRKRSLSLLMTLGMMMANGAREDARDRRERVRRKLERGECRTAAAPESR
jgi:hypothetical protein